MSRNGPNDLTLKTGKRIRTLREARGWSQRELATRAKVAPQTVLETEAAIGSPTLTTLAAIAKALEVLPFDLVNVGDDDAGAIVEALRLTPSLLPVALGRAKALVVN